MAEAEATPAETSGIDPVPLVGSSSPTGVPPRFTPIATAPTVEASAGLLPSPRLDTAVIAAAERTAELARREWATMGLSVQAEKRLSTNPSPAAEIASRAADRLKGRFTRRLRLACRKLARQRATTSAAVAAKARAVLEVQSTSASDDWWTALRDSTNRDAAQLEKPCEAATSRRGPGPLPSRAEMMATVDRYHAASVPISGEEPDGHPLKVGFAEAWRDVEVLADDLADHPADTLDALGTKAAVFAAIVGDVGMVSDGCLGFALEVEALPRLVRSVIADAARLGSGPSRQATADPACSAHLGPESLVRSEGAGFAAAAREWAAAELHFLASIEAGASGLDALALRQDDRRERFLDIPARTLDGMLAKSLVLSWFIDDGLSGETLRASYEALRTATLNTAEANLAFPVMQDLAAIAAARGFSVEALAALPTPDVEAAPGAGGSSQMTDIAALTAEWVRSCAEDQRDSDTFDVVTKGPNRDAEVARMRADAARHCDLLWRIADLRSTSPDVLALKAAVVLADCRDAAGLDADIARRDGTSFGEAEIAVALSLVRDIGALHGAPVRRLVAAVATAAELPIAGEVAPARTIARAAA